MIRSSASFASVSTFLVVSGSPGSGKTELATPLAERLSLPLLTKDTIKEVLAGLYRPEEVTVAASQRLGALAFDVLFAVAANCNGGAVLDAAWSSTLAPAKLERLPGTLIELREGARAEAGLEDALVAFCRERLAHFKCPRTVEFTDALPRHETGKIYRRLLRDRYWQGRDRNI